MSRRNKKNDPYLLKRLWKDQSGNTIIFVGASLIPLLALVGGGLDASRGYMAKSRLQQACDAGTLAGRRAIETNNFDANARAEAQRLFNANFESDFLGSSNTQFTATPVNSGATIAGSASTEVPTALMRIFGYETIDLNVNCQAFLDVRNADITFVLDTTGSMSQTITGGTSRIQALRNSAKDFYKLLDNATQVGNARIRYSFIPYSSTVNVGNILVNQNPTNVPLIAGANPGENTLYPTRRAVYEVDQGGPAIDETTIQRFEHPGPPTSNNPTIQTLALFTAENCEKYGRNEAFEYFTLRSIFGFTSSTSANSQFVPQSFTPNPAGTPLINGNITTSYSPLAFNSGVGTQTSIGGVVNGAFVTYVSCNRLVRRQSPGEPMPVETFDGNLPGATFKRYEHRNLEWPVSDYVASINPTNPRVRVPSERVDVNRLDRWQGCIEERPTVGAFSTQIAYDGNQEAIVPLLAQDLRIDETPSDFQERWRPYWPAVAYNRVNDAFTFFSDDPVTINGLPVANECPQQARLLAEMNETDFNAYVDSLTPRGNTYHDIGMLWGAKLSSPDGIFADIVNAPAINGGEVSRNLVFMTDGVLAPNFLTYSAYGTEWQNSNVTTRGNRFNLTAAHEARFQAVCAAIKAKNIRIFVVALNTSLSNSLQACASPDSASTAQDADELNARFLEIANSIADLRLTN